MGAGDDQPSVPGGKPLQHGAANAVTNEQSVVPPLGDRIDVSLQILMPFLGLVVMADRQKLHIKYVGRVCGHKTDLAAGNLTGDHFEIHSILLKQFSYSTGNIKHRRMDHMKNRITSACLLLVIGLAGCVNISQWQTVHGSGQINSEVREVRSFSRVAVSGSGELTLVQGDTESLTIETDENLLPLIKSEVSHGELRIGWDRVNLRPTHKIHYQLRVKDLDSLHLSGSLHANTGPIKTGQLELSVSGSGSIQIERLEADRLSSHLSGSGSTRVEGKVDEQTVHISGSGSHYAGELRCQRADSHLSGSGQAKLWVKNDLVARISGSGSIDYYGHPRCDIHTSGSGRVHRLGDK